MVINGVLVTEEIDYYVVNENLVYDDNSFVRGLLDPVECLSRRHVENDWLVTQQQMYRI